MSDDAPDDFRPSGFDTNHELTRSDINLFVQATRNDWPVSPQSRQWVLRELGTHAETAKSKRTRLIALKAIAAIAALNIKQGMLDLNREKFEFDKGVTGMPTVEDAIREAQAAAERYDREHADEDRLDPGGAGEVPGQPEPLQ